ncbi:MAG: glycyl-radical enzyme activating protein, partial [Armatimonadota bacterium]|nr:glycyl-radical enzyme activating protein [Armatimonadota bacterium]
EVIVRVPVVPGYNDGEGLIAGLEGWLRAKPLVSEVHLMPYNRLAESKYGGLGMEYALAGLAAPTDEEMEEFRRALEEAGVRVRVGG